MLEDQQADDLGKQRRGVAGRSRRRATGGDQRRFDRAQGIAQAPVEAIVQRRRQPHRSHTVEKIEAQVQLPRMVAVEGEEGNGGGPQPGSRRRVFGDRRRDAGVQSLQRFAEQRTVDLLLAGEIAVQGARRVAGPARNLAQTGAGEAQFGKGLLCGLEDQTAPHVADRLRAASPACLAEPLAAPSR